MTVYGLETEEQLIKCENLAVVEIYAKLKRIIAENQQKRLEIKMVIKDCIFEGVMMGKDLKEVVGRLHHVDGYAKEDIIEAYREMVMESIRYDT
jgi:hypothetical protein